MCHHTAGPTGNMPSLRIVTNGRTDLPGRCRNSASGVTDILRRRRRAGQPRRPGNWQGITTGNSSFIGIEAENTGKRDAIPGRRSSSMPTGAASRRS